MVIIVLFFIKNKLMVSFSELLSSSGVISGKFDFRDGSNDLMDLDINNKKFVSCEFIGGDFASSSFVGCVFDNFILKDSSLVGVTFLNCSFKKCCFLNVDSSFDMENCEIESFSQINGDL